MYLSSVKPLCEFLAAEIMHVINTGSVKDLKSLQSVGENSRFAMIRITKFPSVGVITCEHYMLAKKRLGLHCQHVIYDQHHIFTLIQTD